MRTILGLALTALFSAPAVAGTEYADTVFWTDVAGGGGDFPAVIADDTVLAVYAQTWHPDPWTGFDGAQSTAWLIAWDCEVDDPFTFPVALPAPFLGQAAFAPENDEFTLEISTADLIGPLRSGQLCIEVAAWNEAEPPGDSGSAQWGFYFDDPIVLSVECADVNGDAVCDAALPPGCLSDPECDDGLFCNGAEACDLDSGDCLPGLPPPIDDGVGCTIDLCDEALDEVRHEGDASACDDGVDCTADACDPEADCTNVPDDGACDAAPCEIAECDPDAGCIIVDDLGDADGDGVCDPDDACPLGELGGLEFGEQVYVYRAGDGAEWPAELAVGDVLGTYAQAYTPDTASPGAQSTAEVGVGPCGAIADWMPGDYYIGEGAFEPNNDEHLALQTVPPEWEGLELCVGWRLQATDGGDCWTTSSEHAFSVPGVCDDSDGDGVCNDLDTCPGFPDGDDADGDGTPDGCDVCPIGDDGALEFWTFQFLSPADDPDDAFPAELDAGVDYDAYGQFFHDFTSVEGAQTVAALGVGPCGDPSSWDTWLDSSFNTDIFSNDEWRSTFQLPPEYSDGEFCLAWRGRSDAAGDDCWAYTDEHPFTANPGDPALSYDVYGPTVGGRIGVVVYDVGVGGRAVLMRGIDLGEGPCGPYGCMGITGPVTMAKSQTAAANGHVYIRWTAPDGYDWPALQVGVELADGSSLLLDPFVVD
ncbi:MAG: hypothetical protein ACI8PZ_001456 [Myxococcota bacterium]|jgi:hypothetical protein